MMNTFELLKRMRDASPISPEIDVDNDVSVRSISTHEIELRWYIPGWCLRAEGIPCNEGIAYARVVNINDRNHLEKIIRRVKTSLANLIEEARKNDA